jgi:hypothetical protein
VPDEEVWISTRNKSYRKPRMENSRSCEKPKTRNCALQSLEKFQTAVKP